MNTKPDEKKQLKQKPQGGAKDAVGETERIAKRIARAGLCSRRQAESWIEEGRVRLNGAVLKTPAVTVTQSDMIEVDGVPLANRERTRLWLLHKPAGTVTTNRDEHNRKTVFDILPEGLPRMVTVGRLDINTEGLLLMTNDGGLARILELPSTGWLRRYRVRAHGKVDQEALSKLSDGIAVDGVLYGSIAVEIERQQGANTWLTVSLREGKNREIKKVLGHLGLQVNRLIRISFGPFQLGEIKAGEIREIRGRTLRQQLGPRLIEQSGADFTSPIQHHTVASKPSASKPSGVRKARKPIKKGSVREETLARMNTRPSVGKTHKVKKSTKGDRAKLR